MKTHIVLCTYNGEAYIRNQINSIINQEIKIDFFHIFDFSSQDNTTNIIKEIDIPKINLHTHLEAKGAASSFFYALEEVSKISSADDCIFLVDQDDVWEPNKTKVILKVFQENIYLKKNIIIAHDVKVTDENLKIKSNSFYTGDPYKIPRDLTQKRILLCNPIIGHTMAISGSFIQTVFKNISIDKYLMHDWAITLFAQRYANIIFIPSPTLSLYRQHENNVLGTMKKINFLKKIKRAFIFYQLLIEQSIKYGEDIYFLDKKYKYQKNDFIFLKKISNSNKIKWLIYPYLIQSSLIHGPTIKRKSLALFFFIHWMKVIFKKIC